MNDTQTLAATPMTDALALGPIASLPSSERWAEAVGLARQLERDLAAARADRAALVAAHEQIERLSRTADRSMVDVASMLGDIARATLAQVNAA